VDPGADEVSGDDGRVDRRTLVRRGLVGGASVLAAGGGYVTARELSGEDDAPGKPGGSRPAHHDTRLFALDPKYANLATFVLATHPRPVREAIERHLRALDANASVYLHKSESALEEEVRESGGRYLGADPDSIALTDSTTMGLGLLYARLRLEPGDEVVTTVHDFYATHEALRLRRELDGVKVRRIRLYDRPEAASATGIVGAVERALRRRTRAVALTWVHSSTGVKLPLRAIADVVARANRGRRPEERILLCVDGVHGFGVEDVSPAELGVDAFATGCHKWLFGPRGTGLIWATPLAWRRLAPTIPSFDNDAYAAWLQGRPPDGVAPGRLMTPGGFHSFEHRWALREAFEFHKTLGGRAKVAERTHALAARLKHGLAEIKGVDVKTPLDESLSAGLVCADVGGRPAEEIVDRLRSEHRVVASVTPYATQYVRFGPSIANTEKDVDRGVEAVAAVIKG
jgi:isopenicillin-N epimerase